MEAKDIRWLQRFENYRNALGRLSYAIDFLNCGVERDENERELLMTGAIKNFELTWELSWKVMKDYAEYQGFHDIFYLYFFYLLIYNERIYYIT